MKFVIAEQWDQTFFYLATLSCVFFIGFVVRIFIG
jgi:hypothetical protein